MKFCACGTRPEESHDCMNNFYEQLKVWVPQTATGAGEAHAQKSAVLEKNLATA